MNERERIVNGINEGSTDEAYYYMVLPVVAFVVAVIIAVILVVLL